MGTGIESASAPQLLFATEFTTFLVAVAGATIVLLRPHLLDAGPRARAALAGGFLALAGTAFLRGSLLAGDESVVALGLELLAVVLLGLATLGWRGEAASRRSLWLALGLLVAAEVAAIVFDAELVASWARGTGAVALGGVLVASARRSIPARFAVAVAVALLLSVLALSVALSLVIENTVQREALKRVEARARAEAEEVGDSALRDSVHSARLAALTIQGSRADQLLDLAAGKGGGSAPDVIARDLRLLADQDLLMADGPMLYVTARRTPIVAQRVDQAGVDALVSSPAVAPVAESRAESTATVQVVEGQALAVGVHRVTARGPDGATLVGFVVATRRLDETYLEERVRGDPAVTLSLADRERVFAAEGGDLTQDAALRVAEDALEQGRAAAVESGLFLAGRAVLGFGGRPALVVVSSISTSAEGTQASLFRILFLVALVTALAAFVLAVAVGERIGRGLRRLTGAAQDIARGDLSVRAAVASRDEVGVLSQTFDSMASSIESLAGELRQSVADEVDVRNRLEAVVGGMGEALLAVDAAGTVTLFNGAARDLFGRSPEAVVGRPVRELGPLLSEAGDDLLERIASPTTEVWSEAAVIYDAGGRRVPVALSAGGLTDSAGAVVGGVYVLRDMRAEREAERAKAELVANLGHELRTPLVPIKGYAQLLLRRNVPPDRRQESLAEIASAVERLETVVDRLLEIASRDTDAAPGPGLIDLAPVVTAAAARWQERAGEAHQVEARLGDVLPAVVGDRVSLERSLDELLANAVKFSPDGGRVIVALRAGGPCGDAERSVELSVADQGIGLPEEHAEALFEAFAQADASATREFGGLGLGLALVQRIVAAHGGELRAASTPGAGATFTIRLPAASEAPEATQESEPVTSEVPPA